MSWSTPKTWVAGATLTASDMNTYLSDNDAALRAGGLALGSQAAGDVLYASSATQLARLAIGTAGQLLQVNSGATAPEWTSSVSSLAVSGDAPTTPAADTLYADTIVKAWVAVSFSGGTPGIDADVNVASLTDNGDGDVTVNFATAMGNANYAVVGTIFRVSPNQQAIHVTAKATGSVTVETEASNGVLTDYDFSLIVVGAN